MLFLYTFTTFLRWKIAIGTYCVIAYCTLFVPLSFKQPSETREKGILCSSISNIIFVAFFASICLSLPPENLIQEVGNADFDWAIFFRLACEITFCYYFVLFSFSFSCSMFHLSCIISYSLALFLSSPNHHNECIVEMYCALFFLVLVPISLRAKIKSSFTACVCSGDISKWHKYYIVKADTL